MARIARVVIPDIPHHIIQRGNRCQKVFFTKQDNPVRAGLVKRAEDYPYSSANARVFKKKDVLLSNNFMLSEIKDWAFYLDQDDKEQERNLFKKYTHLGRPLGDEGFIERLERITGRSLRKRKPGPKKPKRNK